MAQGYALPNRESVPQEAAHIQPYLHGREWTYTAGLSDRHQIRSNGSLCGAGRRWATPYRTAKIPELRHTRLRRRSRQYPFHTLAYGITRAIASVNTPPYGYGHGRTDEPIGLGKRRSL